jgi:hypothetical protein
LCLQNLLCRFLYIVYFITCHKDMKLVLQKFSVRTEYLDLSSTILTFPIVLQVSSSKTLLFVFNTGRGPVFCRVSEKSKRSFRDGDRHNSLSVFTRMEPTGNTSSAVIIHYYKSKYPKISHRCLTLVKIRVILNFLKK